MKAKRIFVSFLVALLLLPCLFSCTVDEDITTTTTTTAPCLSHKDADVNMVCDLCGETSLTPGQGVAYEDYTALTAEEQLAFIESFLDMEDFLLWYDIEKTKYDEANQGEDLGGGDIVIGGNGN